MFGVIRVNTPKKKQKRSINLMKERLSKDTHIQDMNMMGKSIMILF